MKVKQKKERDGGDYRTSDISGYFQVKRNIYFPILLLAASLIIIVDNILSYNNTVRLAEDSVKLHALAIAVSLEAALKDIKDINVHKAGPGSNIFRDIITEGRWEGIAFIALYDIDGRTLLHSNVNLIGRTIRDSIIEESLRRAEPIYDYILLGTGEQVFVINMPIHTIKDYKGAVLRVAIHTFQMDRQKRAALIKVLSMFVVMLILWLFAWLMWKAMKRSDRLKEEMAERERLAVIGEMSAVLAHEIRNPLGSIKGFAQYMRESQGISTDNESLDIIIKESSRLERLTEDLLVYARPIDVKKEPVFINELIDEVLAALNLEAYNISVSCLLGVSLIIYTDRDKLRQVVLNLLINARHAIDRARDSIDRDGVIDITSERTDQGIIISIRDNGEGIAPEIAGRIFNPFFTTKTQGTGLGLAIVSRIIKALGGSIEFTSEPGKGTEFKLFIKDLKEDE